MEPMNYFEYLPDEIFIGILMQLDGVTLGKCRRVAKYWKNFIHDNDQIWHEMCLNEYKYSSQIAKRKAGKDLQWYHIYKNLKMWSYITTHEKNFHEFYKFTRHDPSHALPINYGLLPLRDYRGIVFYETSTLKLLPFVITDTTCVKIESNHLVSVILSRIGLFVQKCDGSANETGKFFEAHNFVLSGERLYFYCYKNIFKCDLSNETITSELICKSNYCINDIQYCDKILYLFTFCGTVLKITDDNVVTEKPLKYPSKWRQILKIVHSVNDNNFVCYSPQIFILKTDKYRHLYLDFPYITALFFYVDDVVIGTKTGEILLYRLSSQKKGPESRPIFDTLAVLPEGKFAMGLDVCERRNGPVIVVSTFFEIYLIEYNFFPHEVQPRCNVEEKMDLYRTLLTLNERFEREWEDESQYHTDHCLHSTVSRRLEGMTCTPCARRSRQKRASRRPPPES